MEQTEYQRLPPDADEGQQQTTKKQLFGGGGKRGQRERLEPGKAVASKCAL